MRITRLLLGVMLAVGMVTTVLAEEYKMVVTFPPGSQSDTIARQLQDGIRRAGTDHLVIENVPGAETIVGTMHFKNTQSADLIMGSSGQVVFNPVLKSDLPYSDADFQHLIYIGTAPAVWITRPDTKLKTPSDLLTNLPAFVGGYASSYNTNLTALIKEKGVKATIVSYKGSPDVVLDVMNGTLDVGIVAVNSSLIGLIKTGKVSVIGSTYPTDITVDDVFMPSVSKRIHVTQFSGFVSIATRPDMPVERVNKLKRVLWAALNDSQTTDRLKSLYMIPDPSNDTKYIATFFNSYRAKIKQYMVN